MGSIVFEYCTDPLDNIACDNPNGSDVSGAVLTNQSGETGFSLNSATANKIVIGRTPADVGNQSNSYTFSNVVNPSDMGPFFVRISAYGSSDGSGPLLYFSSVAASIDQHILINGEVPPILYFCSAISIPVDCGTATGDFIQFGDLSTARTSFGTSQFMVGTNAPNGYTISTTGPTMTSGTDAIPALTVPAISKVGFSQFGLNLKANLSPLVGADMVGGSGLPMPDYSITNKFKYSDGEVVASSGGPSELALFTASYIVNINLAQKAGVYNTTITYVCLGGF